MRLGDNKDKVMKVICVNEVQMNDLLEYKIIDMMEGLDKEKEKEKEKEKTTTPITRT